MPATINGIGTTYYGKKHLQQRPGLCPHCSKGTTLSSYDTRLWFVVLYLPVIPLGRKRILDSCPLCTNHGAMPLHKWEEFKQESLSTLLADFQGRPTDPEAAEKLHAQLLLVGQHEEAGRVAKLMAERFPKNPKLLAYLGHSTAYWGRPDEAAEYFDKAFLADPNLPDARTGLASALIRKGRLEEAHNLLRFLEKEPEPDAAPLLELAEAYQKQGRHRQALEVFTLVSTKYPAIARDKVFRKMVRNSEKGRTPGKAIIPPGLGATLKWATVVILLAAVIFGSNYYISRNRTLYVLNGYDTPMQVQIGEQAVRVPKGGFREVPLPEGDYDAAISGPITTNIPFAVSAGFFERWLESPVFVLNPGAQAVFFQETTVYSARPVEDEFTGTFHLYFGKEFDRVPDVDYEFEPFPDEIKMSSKLKKVSKKRVDMLVGPVEDVFDSYAAEDPARALELAEWRLQARPGQPDLLPSYVALAVAQGQPQRAERVIQKMLGQRPVLVDWHRFHQEWQENAGTGDGLIAQYDQWLREDPASAPLQYLRGRLALTRKEAAPFYQKAVELDPRLPYSYLAQAFGHSAAGEWPSARALLARAAECAPERDEFQEVLFTARLACGEFDALEKELKTPPADEPLDFQTAQRLHQVLLAANKPDEAREHYQQYRRALAQVFSPEYFPPTLDYVFLYAAGDHAALYGLCTETNGLAEVAWQPLLEQGQPAQALAALGSTHESWNDPFTFLALAAGLRHHHKDAEAVPFFERALSELKKGKPEFRQLAVYLSQKESPSLEDLADLSLEPRSKAVALLNLSQFHPGAAPALRALARQLNVERVFPYHLIQSLTKAPLEK